MTNVIELPVPRAVDIPLLHQPAPHMARALVTQYWRRSQLMLRPACRPETIAVFDEAIVRALACLKQHLTHAPQTEAACLQAIDTAAREVLHEPSHLFALACLEILLLQQKQVRASLPRLFGPHLQAQPTAVFNALRFCLDPAVGEYLAALAAQAPQHESPSLAHLLMRLAISRPAVSDTFAQTVAAWVSPMAGGLAALCGWRCTGQGDEAKALAAVQQGDDAQAALVALALMASPRETPCARDLLARTAHSAVALALVAARDGHALARSLREARHPQMPWSHQAYAAALVGDIPLLRHLAAHTAWDDEQACRTVADATALLVGTPVDAAFDMAQTASSRAAHIDAQLAALPLDGPPLRLGIARSQALLEDAAALVGPPLRHLLYIEHTSRVNAALWIEADDLALVQALACATASMIERAAYRPGGMQP